MKNNRKTVFGVMTIFYILLLSCSDPILNRDIHDINELGIVFVLYPWARYQVGVISQTDDPDIYSYGDHNFTDVAKVSINGIKFESIPADSLSPGRPRYFPYTYNYISDSLKVANGQTYRIRIEIPGDRIVTGKTIIPDFVQFEKITEDKTDYYVHWQGPDSLVYSWSLYVNLGDESNPEWQEYLSGRTSYAHFAKISKEYVYADTVTYRLSVYTFDYNYTQYLVQDLDRCGINSHYGLFGSVSETGFNVSFP